MHKAKILYGVCGIGMGHTYRQLPLLDVLAAEAQIVMFVYGESLEFYGKHFAGNANVSVVPVSVPKNIPILFMTVLARRLINPWPCKWYATRHQCANGLRQGLRPVFPWTPCKVYDRRLKPLPPPRAGRPTDCRDNWHGRAPS